MCYYEDVRYRGKRIIRSQHRFTMEISYRVNPISFFRDLLAYTIGKWITSKIVFSSRAIGQIFYAIPLRNREKSGENITTI